MKHRYRSTRFPRLARCLGAFALGYHLLAAFPAFASRIEPAIESGDRGIDHFETAVTVMGQQALRAGEGTANFNLDLIGSLGLRRAQGQSIGDTHLIFWLFSVDNVGNSISTDELSSQAGLLWDTNDIAVSSSVTQFGILGIRQLFFDDRWEIGVGKLFPGQLYLESPYSANNAETFSSKMISNDPAARYFDAIGLGIQTQYKWTSWYAGGGFTDANGERELDFTSLADGNYTWVGEIGYRPEREYGTTNIAAIGFHVDENGTLASESGWSALASHDFGERGRYGAFARYTFRNGGEALLPDNVGDEQPVVRGGFLGAAWNGALGHERSQLAVAYMHGTPSDAKRARGFDDTWGLETYAVFAAGNWLSATVDLQLARTRDAQLETVLGGRIKIRKQF